ncbi:sensor histidine kinase [Jejuia spongiicola]|uniref:Histidine kinase n=1 Tax=Jejuia spongiicola TaxID=2942207 RepID=A0ABT0QAA8_9FLAO|nr:MULTISPECIES: histidine kinase [Flavobacteriaceae]MCL6293917.1 histidine kinase [Jejuia spongiicola]PIA78551.1 histidine kinase [Gaetbulibacter sp. 4G1]
MKRTFSIFNTKIRQTIALKYHILFWLSYFTFNVIRWGSYFNDYLYSLKTNLIEFPIHIIIVYFNVYYLIPKFVLRKKYWKYIGSIIIILILVYIVRTGLIYFLVSKTLSPELERPVKFLDINHFIVVALGELYAVTFVTAIKLLVDWTIEKRRNEDLAKLQMSTELKYLRTQIQPHFFFNTLNNLYALTLKKSDNAPRLVLKLSDIMQYVLYEVVSSKANLLQEINHINNFIDIERMRFKDRIEFDMDITGEIDGLEVPPLLFLSFVENCFKHGLNGNDKVQVNMSFNTLNNRYLEFNVANNFNPKNYVEENHGIGIANAKRRLQLLFSNDFILETKIEGNIYNLFLKIPV